jgi:hypothetical protein
MNFVPNFMFTLYVRIAPSESAKIIIIRNVLSGFK